MPKIKYHKEIEMKIAGSLFLVLLILNFLCPVLSVQADDIVEPAEPECQGPVCGNVMVYTSGDADIVSVTLDVSASCNQVVHIIDSTMYERNKDTVNMAWYSLGNCPALTNINNYTLTISNIEFMEEEQSRVFTYYAVCQDDKITPFQVTVCRTDSAPVISAVTLSGNTIINRYGMYLTGDTACRLKVTATDSYSGIMRYGFQVNGGEIQYRSVGGWIYRYYINGREYYIGQRNPEVTCNITLESNSENRITVYAYNGLGIPSSSISVNQVIRVDCIAPEITIQPGGNYLIQDEIVYTRGDANLNVIAEEGILTGSGVRNLIISVNDVEIFNQDVTRVSVSGNEAEESALSVSGQEIPVWRYETQIEIADLSPSDIHRITVSGDDIVGNTASQTMEVRIDNAAPEISNIMVTGSLLGESSQTTQAAINPGGNRYGFLANGNMELRVTAKDNDGGVGLGKIYYRLTDGNGSSVEQGVEPDAEGSITISIPANFKGSIYLDAEDRLGNRMSSPVTIEKLVIENEQMFRQEEHIRYTLPETPYHDASGLNLYSGITEVPVVVTDTFAGIRNIKWEISDESGYRKNGEITIDDGGNVSSGNWTKAGTDSNLVTQLKGNLAVEDNHNHICVKIQMTNRIGYTTEEVFYLSIDQTVPVVELSQAGELPDEEYNSYYKTDCLLEIRIIERNFDPGLAEIFVYQNGTPRQVSGGEWEFTDNVNQDAREYRYRLPVTGDGDYVVRVACTDMAGNLSETKETEPFTIDLTVPVIEISYEDTVQAANGIYYSAARRAVITVQEHNFNPERIIIDGKAQGDGTELAFPVRSDWITQGDTHTTYLEFTADGSYSFQVSGCDMAGNQAAIAEETGFILDCTVPEIRIFGVSNLSSNAGSCMPEIHITDRNFEQGGYEVRISGCLHEEKIPAGSVSQIDSGIVYLLDDFAYEKSEDDVYHLVVTATDRAGNQSSEEIRFSVNRFGSAFTVNDELGSILGSYINYDIPVVVTETNPDLLQNGFPVLVLSRNGTPRTLVAGEDYEIGLTGDEDSMKVYEYTLLDSCFAGDGKYTLAITSMDAAGNRNDNQSPEQLLEISFGIDRTLPVVTALNLENGQIYNAHSYQADFSIIDNLVLEDVEIHLNGQMLEYTVENDFYHVLIPERNQKQTIEVIAYDAAGNKCRLSVENVLVTTNPIVRWFYNTPLFLGSLVGMVGVIGGMGVFCARRILCRRRSALK